MKQAYGKRVSETNICNSGGYCLNPLIENTQPKLILTQSHTELQREIDSWTPNSILFIPLL
jgi:hypothetical protein